MRRALFITVALATSACGTDDQDPLFDPLAPGATGTIALAPGVTTTGYNMVAIRMTPMGNDTERTADVLLPGTWPLSFDIGGGIGASSRPTQTWHSHRLRNA